MIEVSHLTRRYGDFTAVDDLSFTLAPGEILGFLGPNGAGKSTTMKMLTGFLSPTSGSVRICGADVATDRLRAQAHIGYLPEGAPAWEEMTPDGFLAFIAEARGLRGEQASAAVESALATMSLVSVRHQRIETLSKGFKRRVGMAQAILHDPEVLILDEPTDGLDPNQKHQVREMIKGLSRDKIVIVSTHILEEVSAVCNRVMVLSAGRLVSDGTPEALMASSRFHGAITCRLGPVDDAMRASLAALRGVREVLVESDAVTLLPGDDAVDLLDEVMTLARARNWAVDSIYREPGRLDEVFRHLTEGAAR